MSNDNTPSPKLRLTEAGLCAWLGQAMPGECIEYHRGFLVVDSDQTVGLLPEHERREVTRTARRAAWAAEQGYVHLLQRRHGEEDFSYLAIVRPRPKGRSPSMAALQVREAA